MTTALTKDEYDQLARALKLIRRRTTLSTSIMCISGGYLRAETLRYSNKWIFIQLTWGISSDCERSRNIEKYRLNRMELVKFGEWLRVKTCEDILDKMPCTYMKSEKWFVEP